jgi:hypothetical protein
MRRGRLPDGSAGDAYTTMAVGATVDRGGVCCARCRARSARHRSLRPHARHATSNKKCDMNGVLGRSRGSQYGVIVVVGLGVFPIGGSSVTTTPRARVVRSLGLLAGAASSTRLATRPPHGRVGSRQGRRDRGTRERRRRAALTGYRRAVGSQPSLCGLAGGQEWAWEQQHARKRGAQVGIRRRVSCANKLPPPAGRRRGHTSSVRLGGPNGVTRPSSNTRGRWAAEWLTSHRTPYPK